MLDQDEDPRVAEALARNDRYLREFVEAFNLCPYAQRCRESGKLHRAVLLEKGGAPGTAAFSAAVNAVATAIGCIERLPPDTVEVGLLLLPALDPVLTQGREASLHFEQLVRAAREQMQSRHLRGAAPFHCVAFHPDFPEDLGDEHRAVRFIRRSPDPTVQLVRASLLDTIRHSDPSGARYVDTTGLSAAALLAISAPLPVAARISQANLATLRRQNPEQMRVLLAQIGSHRRQGD